MRLTLVGGWNRWLAGLAVMSFALVVVGRAHAQSSSTTDPSNVRLCDTLSTCSGTLGTSTILVSSGLPTLSFTDTKGTSGEAYLVIFVPNTTATFQVNGTTPAPLGSWGSTSTSNFWTQFSITANNNVGGNIDFSNLSTFSAQAGVTATSYNVYIVDLGQYDGSTPISITFSDGSLPAGTYIYGFLTTGDCTSSAATVPGSNNTCTAVDATPNSAGVTIVPEPGTLGLVGAGLLLLGLAIRRREVAKP